MIIIERLRQLLHPFMHSCSEDIRVYFVLMTLFRWLAPNAANQMQRIGSIIETSRKMPTRYLARHDIIEVTFLWERRCLNDGFRTFGAVTTDDMLSCAEAP